MILHFAYDEKFIDYAIFHFERVAPSQNVFVVVIPAPDYELQYIQQKEKIRLIANSNENAKKLMSELYQYDAVIFHSLLSPFFLKILHFADSERIKLVWILWGGEFYYHPSIEHKYMGELTKSAFYSFFAMALHNGKDLIKRIVRKGNIVTDSRKISHIVALEAEYVNIQREWGGMAKVMWYSYYSIEKTVGSLMNEYVNDNNIFIGNSATMTNNHLEIFQILKDFDLKGRKIVAPLSYGETKYRDYIVEQGRKLWGNDFVPLLSFMEREKYNRCILGCNIVVMNHYRQQSVGNMITALWLGAKLFMSERSPIYGYFKSMGVIVYSVEKDLHPENTVVFTPLALNEINVNRNILYERYSLSSILENVALLIRELSV
jgi:hypothetical protein